MGDGIPVFGSLNYAILFVYLAGMVGIGILFAGKQKTTEDYFLAGRKMPWLVVGMSMFASLLSAISYMGAPGTVYKENIAPALVCIVSPIVAPVLIFTFYPFYRRLRVTTSYEYIAKRYRREARFAVSGLFLLARMGWLGVVIYAPALALSVVTGINLVFAIGLMGILATLYTVLGGLSAVLWTDVAQFIILAGGAIWVAVTLVLNVPDGISGIINIARASDHLRLLQWEFNPYEMTGIAVLFAYFFGMMQDYGTDQVTVQRLLAVKSFRGMAKSVLFNALSDVWLVGLLVFIGLGLFAYFQSFPERLAEGMGGDRVLPYYIMHALPQGISGLIITAIFAAAMSSMDSGINSLGTVIVNDFIKPLRHRMRGEHADVQMARWLVLALGIFATGVAFFVSRIEHILKAAQTFLGLFNGPILALFLMGILTRRGSFRGWVVGVVCAIPATIWLQFWVKIHFVYYFLCSFGISLIVGYLASLLLGLLFGGPKAPAELTLWGRSKLGQADY